MSNTLWYGDNLEVLRNHIPDESVDLIYLDPPFNSNRNYNLLFKEKSGTASPAQLEAFEDAWTWDQAAELAMDDIALNAPTKVARTILALREMLGDNDMMAYLAMMAQRLVELHRVLKSSGSLYLHCDPKASHYLKLILDGVFGVSGFVNEIVWKRSAGKGDATRKFGSVHDIVLRYAKGPRYLSLPVHLDAGPEYLARFPLDDGDGRGLYHSAPLDSPNPRPNLTYSYKGYPPPVNGWRVSREVMEELDGAGRLIFPRSASGRLRRKLYLKDQSGPSVSDVWTDLPPLQSHSQERLGFPTQKPLALLERVIQASSNPGDVVLDPFCGCGTAIAAAEKLGRRWIGIDVTYLAIAVMQQRFRDHFPDPVEYEVKGIPRDVTGARALFESSPYQFQWWAVDQLGINARPFGDKKKGRDRGIDGEFFYSDERGHALRGIIQVKGGKTSSRDIRDFRGTLERETVELGVFVCLQEPTRDMRADAASAGFVDSAFTGRKHPRIQILTIDQLFDGYRPDVPHLQSAHQKAPKIVRQREDSKNLPLELPGGTVTLDAD